MIRAPGVPFLFAIAGACVVLAIFSGSIMWGYCPPVGLGLLAVALIATVTGLFRMPVLAQDDSYDGPQRRRRQTAIVLAAVAAHIAIAAITLHNVRGEIIDTFTFQRDAANKLCHGINPYGTISPDYYTPDKAMEFYGPHVLRPGVVYEGMPYTPVTLLWIVPGYLFGDLRYSYVAATVLAALAMFVLSPGTRSAIVACVLLLDPMTFFIESRAWTEPLGLMMLAVTVGAALRKSKWLPVPLGVFLVCKQYNVLALPFLYLLRDGRSGRSVLKLALCSLLVSAATFLPFFWGHIRALWHDLVLFHMAMPFREDSLSFSVPFHLILQLGPVLVLGLVMWLLMGGIRERHPGCFPAAYGAVLLVFVATSKQGLDNYYFLVGHAFLLSSAALTRFDFWRSTPVAKEAQRLEARESSLTSA